MYKSPGGEPGSCTEERIGTYFLRAERIVIPTSCWHREVCFCCNARSINPIMTISSAAARNISMRLG